MQKEFITGLKLKNSLTSNLELFIPRDGKNIKWYTCGPTVYSNSHMGHARNYLCNDMIRRVLSKHFGYNIQYCMNITDVDDKIINKSNEQGIEYFEFARKWEHDFFQDMSRLNVETPDYITRVTQYIPQIVSFIQKIVDNGYAYSSNGSVYFDIQSYKQKFKYGKLKRINDAQTEQQQKDEKNQKKNKQDFALWKAAKPNEPKWQSPWGQGRPGWHIECSAMAYSILGHKMDIHSGGIDLIFPHHENQLAQSEAFNNEPDWTNYFIHVGHLHIKGLKMSKSLKNFITIKNLLEIISPRIIQLYFYIHRYDVILNYDPETSLKQSTQKDERYKSFFGNLRAAIRSNKISAPQKLSQQDFELDKSIDKTREGIHEAFCNNIDTPSVVKQVDELIKKVNTYLQSKTLKVPLLIKAYKVLIHPFNVMGLQYDNPQSSDKSSIELMNTITKFRDEIRSNSKSDFKKILQICDRFRDYDMVQLGIRLEDKNLGQASVWQFDNKQQLIKRREQKQRQNRERVQQKLRKQQQKLKKQRVNPLQMFRGHPDYILGKNHGEYTQWDQQGIPTHQKWQKIKKDGQKQVDNKTKQSILKQRDAQKQIYEKYLNSQKKEQ